MSWIGVDQGMLGVGSVPALGNYIPKVVGGVGGGGGRMESF